jgi:GxxExxY protein
LWRGIADNGEQPQQLNTTESPRSSKAQRNDLIARPRHPKQNKSVLCVFEILGDSVVFSCFFLAQSEITITDLRMYGNRDVCHTRCMNMTEVNVITSRIIGAAIEVHRLVGPGLLESAYEQCLLAELTCRGLRVEVQQPVPLSYKGQQLDYAYRLDMIVEGCVVVEVKSVEKLSALHEAQTLTYMRLVHCPIGLLINFNVPRLVQGLKRMIIDVGETKGQPSHVRPPLEISF